MAYRKLTYGQCEAAFKQKQRGATYEEVQAWVRETYGISVSVETLRKGFGELARSGAPAPPPPANDAAEGEGGAAIGNPEEVLKELWSVLKDLRRYTRQPDVKANRRDYLSAMRSLADVASRCARYLPKPKDDPEEHPDMVAAADRCRAKLHDVLAGLVARKKVS